MHHNRPPRTPRLSLDVALSECPCAAPDCVRVVQPGETLIMREMEGYRGCSEPLCEVHGTEAQADAKLQARLWLHARDDRRATMAMALATPG